MRIFKSFLLALSLIVMTTAAAQAQVTVQGVPVERGVGFQDPATPIMERAVAQYNVLILPIVTAVTLFVLALLLWTCWKSAVKIFDTPRPVLGCSGSTSPCWD